MVIIIVSRDKIQNPNNKRKTTQTSWLSPLFKTKNSSRQLEIIQLIVIFQETSRQCLLSRSKLSTMKIRRSLIGSEAKEPKEEEWIWKPWSNSSRSSRRQMLSPSHRLLPNLLLKMTSPQWLTLKTCQPLDCKPMNPQSWELSVPSCLNMKDRMFWKPE